KELPATIKLAGGITAPHGFSALGANVGIKKKKTDLAIIACDVPATVAASFTTNVVKAAPILWSQEIVEKHSTVQAIVINSGNANACTGAAGSADTKTMAAATAKALSLDPEKVLVASTGVIGVPLPIDSIEHGVKAVMPMLGRTPESGTAAAEA